MVEASKDMSTVPRGRRCSPSVGGSSCAREPRVGIQAGGHTATVSADRLPLVVVPCFNEERRLDPVRLGSSRAPPPPLPVRRRRLDGRHREPARTAAGHRRRGRRSHASAERRQGGGNPTRARPGTRAGSPGRRLLRRRPRHAAGRAPADGRPPRESTRSRVRARRARGAPGQDDAPARTRHYLGRVFATFASLTLHIPCLRHAVRSEGVPRVRRPYEPRSPHPFRSSWVFDVELIGRLRAARVAPIRSLSPRSRRCRCSSGATSRGRVCGYATWGVPSWICSPLQFGCTDRAHARMTRRMSSECRTIGAHTAPSEGFTMRTS